MFSKLLLYLCQVSNGDGPYPVVGPGTKGEGSPTYYHYTGLLAHVSYIRWYQVP